MEVLKIKGENKLSGTIEIGGAKNSAVALVPAAILSDEVTIENVPEISDVRSLEDIINYLGAEFYKEGKKLTINSKGIKNKPITLEHSKKLRASYYFMGALLGKYKKAEMYFPGGCPIGKRPINLHLEAFEKLGARIKEDGNKYIIEAKKLIGTDIDLKIASVGATINILLASCRAEGVTTIHNAAKEPEVGNVVDFLNSMGAKITGKDTSTLVIEGVKKLAGGKISVIPDRIEAGTYIIAGALLGDKLVVDKIIPKHLEALLNQLRNMGADMEVLDNKVIVSKTSLKPSKIVTEVFPGFPTDLQQPFTTLLTQVQGESMIKETIYENRFQNVHYLDEMGASIKINKDTINIKGATKLKGKTVKATDLRAGASLVLAGLIASGETVITDINHVLRGYEKIIKKLSKVGAQISLERV